MENSGFDKLGKLGRDKVTGFEGVIIAKAIHLFGCNHYSLAPKAKDNEIKGSVYFDEGRIEIIGEVISAEEVKVNKPDGLTFDAPELGKLGRDKVTGFEGIIVAKVINLFDCNDYALLPKAVDSLNLTSRLFDEGRIEIIGDAITPEEVKSDKPGGVTLDSPDNRVL
jgi:hypothetical protein